MSADSNFLTSTLRLMMQIGDRIAERTAVGSLTEEQCDWLSRITTDLAGIADDLAALADDTSEPDPAPGTWESYDEGRSAYLTVDGTTVAVVRDKGNGLWSYLVVPIGRPDIDSFVGDADSAEAARHMVAHLLAEHPPIDDSATRVTACDGRESFRRHTATNRLLVCGACGRTWDWGTTGDRLPPHDRI